jgi:hypothetical protein
MEERPHRTMRRLKSNLGVTTSGRDVIIERTRKSNEWSSRIRKVEPIIDEAAIQNEPESGYAKSTSELREQESS